jgi:hypothetical protein
MKVTMDGMEGVNQEVYWWPVFRIREVLVYSGRGKFMPLPLKSKLLETPGSLVTDDIKMFPL